MSDDYKDRAMPQIDLYGGNVDLRTVAPLYGVQTQEPDYLDYDIKGRGAVERMFLYTGTSYLTGIFAGGFYGARVGYKTSPSPRFWIRVNSVMNGAGKLGSKFGNNAGVIALLYSSAESALDALEVSTHLGDPHPALPSVMAGALTGLVYKATAAPRTMALASVLGGVSAGLFTYTRTQLDRFFGYR